MFPFPLIMGTFAVFLFLKCNASDVDESISQLYPTKKRFAPTNFATPKVTLQEQDLKKQMRLFQRLASKYHGEEFDPSQTHIPKLKLLLKRMHVYALELCRGGIKENEAFHIGKLIKKETRRLSKTRTTMSLYVSSALRYALLIDYASGLYHGRYKDIVNQDWLFKDHGTKTFDHDLKENLFPQKLLELADFPFNFYVIFLHPKGILPADFFVKGYCTKPFLSLAALGRHDIKADDIFSGSFAFLVHDIQVHQLLLMDLCRQISMQLSPFSPRLKLTSKDHDRTADGFFILQRYITDTVEKFKDNHKKMISAIHDRIFYAVHENGLITLLKRDKWKTAQECFDVMIG